MGPGRAGVRPVVPVGVLRWADRWLGPLGLSPGPARPDSGAQICGKQAFLVCTHGYGAQHGVAIDHS